MRPALRWRAGSVGDGAFRDSRTRKRVRLHGLLDAAKRTTQSATGLSMGLSTLAAQRGTAHYGGAVYKREGPVMHALRRFGHRWFVAHAARVRVLAVGVLVLGASVASIVVTSAEPAAADNGARGYWLATAKGDVYNLGTAPFKGSLTGKTLNSPIVGVAAAPATSPTSAGYWLVASDGGIFAFGDATFHGPTGAITLNKPMVGMATTKDGGGYWLVASDGGVFAFGDAGFHGSTGAITLNKPIVGMAHVSCGPPGYWLAAADGGIFGFGGAAFSGSEAGKTLPAPVVGMGLY